MRDIVREIKERARALHRTIVLPETWEIRTLKAAAQITAEGFASVILVGKPAEVAALAGKENVALGTIPVLDPDEAIAKYGMVEKLVELRKGKGLTPEQAREMLKDYLYVGSMLVKEKVGHGYVAGAVNSTANTVRSALHIHKTKPGIKTLSSCFLMVVPECTYGADGMFIYADCAIVPNPTAEQLADIAIISAESCRTLIGVEPVVAMLSFSTKGSATDPLLEKVIEATKLVKQRAPQLQVDGELQADAAIIAAIGAKKAPGSTVAGKANTLIFPDLNSGNICYKLTERLAKAGAYGPVLQGAGRPVNDLSRGCSVEDIVVVSALTALQD